MTVDHETATTVARSSAEYAMQELAGWLPTERHDALRELLFDLCVTAVHAYLETKPNYFPQPSNN